MVRIHLRWLTPVLLCAAAAAAQSQPLRPAPKADPLDASAPVPRLVYESSLLQYQRLRVEEPLAWREANDRVGRIGGWRAYAREAQGSDDTPRGPASAASQPAHQGHHGQGKP